VLYDLSLFFLVVIIIIQNLIFGVIIDTFANLRAEKNRKDMLKNTCFICGECEKWRDQSSSKFQLTVWLALVLNLPPHFLPFLSFLLSSPSFPLFLVPLVA